MDNPAVRLSSSQAADAPVFEVDFDSFIREVEENIARILSSSVVQYEHHGVMVHVREDLKGKHREHCLCWSCDLFVPDDRIANCEIANALFSLCVDHNVVTPVYECPKYIPKNTSRLKT